jgi:hypothetical protein
MKNKKCNKKSKTHSKVFLQFSSGSTNLGRIVIEVQLNIYEKNIMLYNML